MDDYLIDRQALGGFVDELIKKKPLPANTPEELSALREKTIQELDDTVSKAIFSGLTKEQYQELNRLLDDPNATEADFDAFFHDADIDVEQNIATAIENFGHNYLGGQNA